jgi:hypothetical protein
MNSKFKIKLGQIELEYEGSEEFLTKELPELLAAVSKLFQETGAAALVAPMAASTQSSANQPQAPAQPTLQLTTGSIASKLKASSGSDLLLAAAARLALAEGLASFTRSQLLKEMQTATTFYKKTYNNNLTKIIVALVKADKLREISNSTYSLSEATCNELRSKLA